MGCCPGRQLAVFSPAQHKAAQKAWKTRQGEALKALQQEKLNFRHDIHNVRQLLVSTEAAKLLHQQCASDLIEANWCFLLDYLVYQTLEAKDLSEAAQRMVAMYILESGTHALHISSRERNETLEELQCRRYKGAFSSVEEKVTLMTADSVQRLFRSSEYKTLYEESGGTGADGVRLPPADSKHSRSSHAQSDDVPDPLQLSCGFLFSPADSGPAVSFDSPDFVAFRAAKAEKRKTREPSRDLNKEKDALTPHVVAT